MAIYTSKTRIDLEDVGYSNKITNKAILKILENAGARQSETAPEKSRTALSTCSG